MSSAVATSRSAIVGHRGRVRLMAKLGVSMMFHDKFKFAGTLFGVVFAVFLANQGCGVFLGLLFKNRMFVEQSVADIWISPPGTQTLQSGDTMDLRALTQARVTPGVAWAEPLLYGGAIMRKPDGGNEPTTLVGVRLPRAAGGPWNLVSGDTTHPQEEVRRVLSTPDTVFFETSQRAKYAGLNLGDMRELSGHQVRAGGFTWGLIPFGPAFAFSEFDVARSILRIQSDRTHHVLVGIVPGQNVERVRDELRRRLPGLSVFTRQDFRASILQYLLKNTQIAQSVGTSAVAGIIVGFFIVALSMFSAVLDNIREFGTLKAIGATNFDLTLLMLTQAITYAVIGTTMGLFLVTRMAAGIRSALLQMVLPPQLFAASYVLMIVVCSIASTIALMRIRKVEPGMVFR